VNKILTLHIFLACHIKNGMAVPVQAIKAYSLVHSLTSALHAGQWSTSRPGRFTPGQDPQYPLNTWPGGSQNRSGRLE